VEFFCLHGNRPGGAELRFELREAHWSYMDGFESALRHRGPTYSEDGATPTGSVHVVDVPDAAAARAFAFEEPCFQAGAFRDVLVRRWRNLLGRTMWEFPGGREGDDRYLVLGLGAGTGADLELPAETGDLIAYGPLLSDDGTAWLGTAVLLRAPDPRAARAILTAGAYDAIELHRWHFGGRPAPR
jgi:hypothetical protein